MRYFVHVYRTVRSKFLIEAADRAAAMELADQALPAANDRLQWDLFKFNDDEARRVPHLLSGTHIATDDADEILGYLIDEVGDTEFERSESFTGAGEPMHDGPGKSHTFTPRQRDTILAALRLWQHLIEGDVVVTGSSRFECVEDLMEIANNDREPGDLPPALAPAEIDALCERVNS